MPTLTMTNVLTPLDEAGLDMAADAAGLDYEHRARLIGWAQQARAAARLVDAVVNGAALPHFDANGHLHVAARDPEGQG